MATAAQEVVLTTGERLPGRVEKYENGLAHILFIQEDGRSMLTTLPESMIDKAATDGARDAGIASESVEAGMPLRTVEQQMPASQPLSDDPSGGLTDLAANERSRRQAIQDSGTSPARSFSDADVRTSIPTSEEVQALADLTTAPDADQDGDFDGMVLRGTSQHLDQRVRFPWRRMG